MLGGESHTNCWRTCRQPIGKRFSAETRLESIAYTMGLLRQSERSVLLSSGRIIKTESTELRGAMQAVFLGGVAIAIVAGFFNGAFVLPLRYAKSWGWENTWLVFCCFALILLPWTAAFLFVPHLRSLLHDAPLTYFLPGVIAGTFWGVSMVLYGLGLDMVGIAVGNAVVASMSAMAGTLGPLIVYAPDKLLSSTGLVLIGAIALVVAGIYTYGKAGARKEKET